ncbi:hypothetical protein [Burkholderia multivorans]|uniref:hypothetical protein n=1 Tax=Burkholderia multivorans TaxID=87883 RepID=UPI002859321A|nr:hypothetical protein [Burkholderia multivorans]MDR8926432.1 hypothetical protein [Burkholderia multivorans]MDR8964017.1 hypothetical protein [Burkholderia multivorans]MDR8992388.1 hypothetical protein [Burkholderia multivorans]MDR9019201.1 hypothetical protein [Burkholderia multivorans]MDR9024869.1 hypothetical protein [Burkholderia multivorans]
MSAKDNRIYREAPPTSLRTPAECGELAEKAIGEFVKACGAYGNVDALPKVLEMLISKAALGIVTVSNSDTSTTILLRTILTAAEYEERRKRRAS